MKIGGGEIAVLVQNTHDKDRGGTGHEGIAVGHGPVGALHGVGGGLDVALHVVEEQDVFSPREHEAVGAVAVLDGGILHRTADEAQDKEPTLGLQGFENVVGGDGVGAACRRGVGGGLDLQQAAMLHAVGFFSQLGEGEGGVTMSHGDELGFLDEQRRDQHSQQDGAQRGEGKNHRGGGFLDGLIHGNTSVSKD